MINKDTILSAFDDKGTLLKWLKKVEKALKESVLSNVEVIKITETRAVIKFIFADNTTITTPEFTLPKGDKGDKGDGFDLLASIYSNTPSFISSNPAGNFNISCDVDFYFSNGETISVPMTFVSSLKGSESVIVDISEDDRHIEIHLDADIVSKIERALLIPLNSSGTFQIVSVSSDNSQTMLGIGAGIETRDDTLQLKNYGLKDFNINTNGHIVGIRFFDCVYNGEYYKQISLERAFDGTENIKCNFFKIYYIDNTSLYVKELNIYYITDFTGLKELRKTNSLLSKVDIMFLNEEDVTIEIDLPNE